MKNASWKSIARSWVGIVAACVAVVAAVWLLSVHIHARFVTPVEKAYVDELKEKARTDTEIQKILQPELDRQHQSAVRRRNVYNRGGLLLLVMAGIFLAWFQWLRPGPGEWRGVPAWLLKYLDRSAAAAPAIEAPAPAEEYCQLGQRECKRYARKGPVRPAGVSDRGCGEKEGGQRRGRHALCVPSARREDLRAVERHSCKQAAPSIAGSPAGDNGNGKAGSAGRFVRGEGADAAAG